MRPSRQTRRSGVVALRELILNPELPPSTLSYHGLPLYNPAESPPRRKQYQHRLQPDEIAELTAAYLSGASAPELAERYHVHRTTVFSVLERQGVPRRYRRLDEAAVQKAAGLYANGDSLATIGQQLGVVPATVARALRTVGVHIRDPHDWQR